MIQRILPDKIDNWFSGQWISLYFFYLITVLTVVRSLLHMFLQDGGAQCIATIPLDTFTKAGSTTLIGIFSYWGLSQLMFGIIQVIVAIRYKSLIPFMYIILIVEWGGRFLLGMYKPIETLGQAPGGIGNIVLPGLCLIMFFLSIKQSKIQA